MRYELTRSNDSTDIEFERDSLEECLQVMREMCFTTQRKVFLMGVRIVPQERYGGLGWHSHEYRYEVTEKFTGPVLYRRPPQRYAAALREGARDMDRDTVLWNGCIWSYKTWKEGNDDWYTHRCTVAGVVTCTMDDPKMDVFNGELMARLKLNY